MHGVSEPAEKPVLGLDEVMCRASRWLSQKEVLVRCEPVELFPARVRSFIYYGCVMSFDVYRRPQGYRTKTKGY
jgi:hypothetical protein